MEIQSWRDGMKEFNWDHSPEEDHRNKHHGSKNDGFDGGVQSGDQEIKLWDGNQDPNCSDNTN